MRPYLKTTALIGALVSATVLINGCAYTAAGYTAYPATASPTYYAAPSYYSAPPVYTAPLFVPEPAVTFGFGYRTGGGRRGWR